MTPFAKILLLIQLTLIISGCGTVTPKVVTFKQPTFASTPDTSGNYQNSGVLGWIVDGDLKDYLIINSDGRDNYNKLISNLKNTTYTNDFGIYEFTNDIIPPLWISKTVKSLPTQRKYSLWSMNPVAQDLWVNIVIKKNNYIPNPADTNKTKSFFLK